MDSLDALMEKILPVVADARSRQEGLEQWIESRSELPTLFENHWVFLFDGYYVPNWDRLINKLSILVDKDDKRRVTLRALVRFVPDGSKASTKVSLKEIARAMTKIRMLRHNTTAHLNKDYAAIAEQNQSNLAETRSILGLVYGLIEDLGHDVPGLGSSQGGALRKLLTDLSPATPSQLCGAVLPNGSACRRYARKGRLHCGSHELDPWLKS